MEERVFVVALEASGEVTPASVQAPAADESSEEQELTDG